LTAYNYSVNILNGSKHSKSIFQVSLFVKGGIMKEIFILVILGIMFAPNLTEIVLSIVLVVWFFVWLLGGSGGDIGSSESDHDYKTIDKDGSTTGFVDKIKK